MFVVAHELLHLALDTFGRVDVWINNAGILRDKTLTKTPVEDFDAVHLHSNGAGPLYRMGVSHSHPDPKTYVAYGRCGGAC
mgnify:CR=1 FL=1